MKKLGSIAAVALFGLMAFTSCKKDYTCTCNVTWTNSTLFTSGDTTYTTSTPFNDQKKSDAKDACDAGDASTSDGLGGTIVSSCELD